MSLAIVVENLSKKYIIGHQKRERYTALRDVLTNGAKRVAHKLIHPFAASDSCPPYEEFWALKDINFDVKQGDRVGIIGRNGAGKSTLLKILSRITEPTTGKVSIKGRVASLLEVGTGFHPELTGRENIFLNGAILGMSRADIKKNFDEIVAFAEVEKFLDTPVKRYSSGMYVRLAFAVAAHLEPEILIVDEVLAVGDAQFQKKCLGKMQDVSTQGRTILFVSHNMGVINALCNKGILLQMGQVAACGTVASILARYMQRSTIGGGGHQFVNNKAGKSGSKANVLEACVLGPKGEPSSSIFVDQHYFIQLVWRLNVRVPFLRVGIEITDSTGVVVLSSMDTDTTDLHGKPREPGIFHETVKMSSFLLMPGNYTVKVFAGIPGIERVMEIDDLLEFEVVDNHSHLSHVVGARRPGYMATPLQWEVQFEHAE
jgi:lipopolysaccharide transport system ATP-binding protein